MTLQSVRSFAICACLGIVLVAGCTVYRPELHQGQTLDTEDIEKITVGMSAQEVLQTLGTPLVTDVFNNQRWDYVYIAYDRDRVQTERSRVSIFFADGAVARIESESEMNPVENQAEAEPPEAEGDGWFSAVKSKFSGFWKKDSSDSSEEEDESN